MLPGLAQVCEEDRVKEERELQPGEDIGFGVSRGRPFAKPYYARVSRKNAEFGWSFDGLWTVHFGARTPLKKGQKVVHGFGKTKVRIASNADGHYSYSVAVVGYKGRTPKIFLDVACPEVIVF
jgi:hypothetical protein